MAQWTASAAQMPRSDSYESVFIARMIEAGKVGKQNFVRGRGMLQ